jgi:hypothetical protein
MPGARCTRSRAWSVVNTRVSHHGHAGSPGIPARNGFNSLFRALPGDRLFDSHILEPQSGAVFDAAEGFEAYSHHLRTGLSIIGGPSSKPGNDPCSEGERTF